MCHIMNENIFFTLALILNAQIGITYPAIKILSKLVGSFRNDHYHNIICSINKKKHEEELK